MLDRLGIVLLQRDLQVTSGFSQAFGRGSSDGLRSDQLRSLKSKAGKAWSCC
jgi:hypothetical protein